MGEVTGKVVGAQLVIGIQAFFQQIVRPNGQHIPMPAGILGISFAQGDGRSQDQHIAAFLHRHIASVGLSVRLRISPDIVCGKRLVPLSAFAVIENRG